MENQCKIAILSLQMVNGWLREGRILCPECEQLCPSATSFLHSPQLLGIRLEPAPIRLDDDADAGMEQMAERHFPEGCLPPENPPWPIGDPAMDEPCAAAQHGPLLCLIIALIGLASKRLVENLQIPSAL